ncbi:MAG: GNAT family N-acetyltransferase [Ferruginibacter sp.]
MNFKLIPATSEYKEVMKNLMQFYMYDFSEYIKSDVESEGLFGAYPNLEDYWKKENHRFPYFIKEDERYIGFVLVRLIKTEERSYFSIAEFFIMKKYRRKGIGKAAAGEVFNLHRGQWEVYQKESNQPARVFWNRVIDKYTRGQYGERLENGRSIQDFEN